MKYILSLLLLLLTYIFGYSQNSILQVEVINECESSYIIINDNKPNLEYYLTNNTQTFVMSTYSDTIYDLPSGEYTLSTYDSIHETVSFSINNTTIDAVLNIPHTTLYLEDSYITPILNIYSMYDYIEWDFGDGNFIQNNINPVHYYSQTGIFTLKVTIGEGQCLKIFETQINVEGTLGINTSYKDIPKYKPSQFYYAIDGKLVKRQ